MHALADAVVVADPEGTIVYWNVSAESLFGWPAAEVVGQPLDMIIPERLRGRHGDGYRETMRTGVTRYGDRLLEVPALRRDGHTFSIAFTVTLMKEAGRTEPYRHLRRVARRHRLPGASPTQGPGGRAGVAKELTHLDWSSERRARRAEIRRIIPSSRNPSSPMTTTTAIRSL